MAEKDVKYDKQRQNELESLGWSVLRFTTYQIEYEIDECINTIKNTINEKGGLLEPKNPDKVRFFPKDQIGLF